jgi:hypothetical protein
MSGDQVGYGVFVGGKNVLASWIMAGRVKALDVAPAAK